MFFLMSEQRGRGGGAVVACLPLILAFDFPTHKFFLELPHRYIENYGYSIATVKGPVCKIWLNLGFL